jgi:hypothetical protein
MAKPHARFTTKDVEAALAEPLDPQAHDHDTWDLFLAWPINDPTPNPFALSASGFARSVPPAPGRDINEEGEKRVASLLADLQRRAQRSGDANALR